MSDLTLEQLLAGDDDSNPGQGGGGALRKQLEAVLATNKALTERLAAQEAAQRDSAATALLAKHGIPELARDLLPKDAELNDETATALVQKYGQLWGASANVATTPPEAQAQTNAVQTFAAQATTGPAAPLSEEEYRAKFAEAKTKDEFLRVLDELSVTAVGE
jgi:hypothetical protein